MGVDLLLKMKGEVVADLGRAYHYIEQGEGEPSVDMGEIDEQLDSYCRYTIEDVMKHFDFISTVEVIGKLLLEQDANFEDLKREVESVREELMEDLHGMTWDLVNYGERRMLARLMSECEDFSLEAG